MAILNRGLAGEPGKVLQQKLGVPTDGVMNPPDRSPAIHEHAREEGPETADCGRGNTLFRFRILVVSRRANLN
jgi:hypothetical protein